VLLVDGTLFNVVPTNRFLFLHIFLLLSQPSCVVSSGAASWWRCLPDLAHGHRLQGKVYAVDWLGVGLSSRPEWPRGSGSNVRTLAVGASPPLHTNEASGTGGTLERVGGRSPNGPTPRECEDFFVESFEAWRAAEGIERFHLVAHSLSAFHAVRYAEM
jgi:pimeloyl-ACP methyl ester carboxylesterase